MAKPKVKFEIQEYSNDYDTQSYPFRAVFTARIEKYKVTGKIDRSVLSQSNCQLYIFSRQAQEYKLLESMIPSEIERISLGHWAGGPCPAGKISFYNKRLEGQKLAASNLVTYMMNRAITYSN